MNEAAWNLPGPRRFAGAIAEDLEDGRTALTFVPERFPSGLRGAIKAALISEGWRFSELDGTGLGAGPRPLVELLADRLGLIFGPSVRLNTGTLLERSELWRQVLFFDLRGVDDQEVAAWSEFLLQHSAASRERTLSERLVICAVFRGAVAGSLPFDHLSFGRHWWWGTLSRLDGEVYVADLLAGEKIDAVFAASVVELASFDLPLADHLIDQWRGDPNDLPRLLTEYAGKNQLTFPVTGIAALPSDEEPSRQLLAPWSSGVVNRWAELNPCVHSALDGIRNGRELKGRVWRAQVRSLLPELELERQRLAEWVLRHRRTLSADWARQDIAGLEIGPLFKLVGETPALRSQREQWELIRWLRDARNSLAHWDVISVQRLKRGRALIAHARDA